MVRAMAWAAQDTPDSSAQADRLLALLMNGPRHRGAPAMTRLFVNPFGGSVKSETPPNGRRPDTPSGRTRCRLCR